MASLVNESGAALMNKFTPPARDYSLEYLTIEALEDGCVVSIRNKNCNILPTFYYSTDGGTTWSSVTAQKSKTVTAVTIDTGETALFKCTQNSHATDWDNYNGFQCSKNYKVYGNAMSLIWGDDFVSNSEFASDTRSNLVALFREDTHVIDASNLILPAMIVMYQGYNGMFRGCTNLEKAPKILPALTFIINTVTGYSDAYSSMFEGCINLEEGSELPATNLGRRCYQRMFCMNRNSKITTPKMTKSPVLPASVVVQNAYEEMFKGNGNLVEVTCLATTIQSNSVNNWLLNCSDTGTFKKAASMSSWPSGTSGIPSGWTIEDYSE